MSRFNGALIGCGFFAENHLHAWQQIPDVKITALCDINPDRLNLLGERFDIDNRYHDAASLFNSGAFDFVDIATTVQTHLPLVKLAAQHRVGVICQKPFALNLQDAKDMVKTCQQAGVPLMVHENFRWQSPIQKVRELVDAGEIGQLFWGRFTFRSAYDVFSGQPYLAKGKRFIIEDLGIHTLDIARYIMGDVSRLSARTARVNPTIAGEDVATMLLDHVSDRDAQDAPAKHSIVDCSYATTLPSDPFPQTLIELDGTLGTLRLKQDYELHVVNSQGHRTESVEPALLDWAEKPWHNIQQSVLAIQQHWITCLENGEPTSTSGADNLKTFALVEAAYQSAQTGESVLMDSLLA